MIILPPNWQETVRVSPPDRILFLHFKNNANQYYTYYQTLDPAYTIDETLQKIEDHDRSNEAAYVLNADLTTSRVEPLDQNWVPAPLPDRSMCSLEQYRASIPKKDEQHAT